MTFNATTNATARSALPVRQMLTALAAALFGLIVAGAASASTIKVLVNDEPITSFDVQQRTQMLKVFSRGKQGQKDAIEQLIDETLMLQEAKKRHITVSDDEVDQEFAGRARAVKLSPQQFMQAMAQAGFSAQTFKDFLRANMAWQQIVRARFRATETISDQDIAAALVGKDETGKAAETAHEYMLQQILFLVPDGSSGGLAAQRKREAESFRKAFNGCDQAVAQAGGTPGIVVKPPVRREESQLTPQLKQELDKLGVGGISLPQPAPEGVQLIAVCAKNEIAGQTEATVTTREDLTTERTKLLARRYLRDLRSDAVIEYR